MNVLLSFLKHGTCIKANVCDCCLQVEFEELYVMLSCRVSLRKLVFVSLTAVGLSLVLCVTSGVYLDFQRVTYTHCQVRLRTDVVHVFMRG